VIPLGVGNFFSTHHFCTSLLLCAGEKKLLIDCPDPFFRICAEASRKSGRDIDPNKIDDLLLTHMHGDHSNGLEGFAFWKKYHSRRKKIPKLYTSQANAKVLWRKLSAAMGQARLPHIGVSEKYKLSNYFEVHPIEEGRKTKICGIEIETRRTLHSIPTIGFRATFGKRRFGYSCDTAFDPKMIEFLAPCDLIFHECDEGIVHTPIDELEALPESIRAKMRLIHLNDRFAGSPLIQTAEEGKVYRV